jgi:hypothetical protein
VSVAQANERVGKLGSLLGCVDLFCDGGESVPAPVGVVPGDGLLQAFEVGADELGQGDQQREIDGGNVDELLPEVVKGPVGETVEVAGGLAGEQCDMSASEMLFGGSALYSAAALDLAS